MAKPESHSRIDEGFKRGPRRKRPDRADPNVPRTALGTFEPIQPERREAAIQDALASLPTGETTDSIAARHGISGQSLRAWLLSDHREAADQARNTLVSNNLSQSIDEIANADDPLALARARESFRAWSWIGERRIPNLYGAKPLIQVTQVEQQNVVSSSELAEIVARKRQIAVQHEPEKLISGDAQDDAE